jgi:hypothetical protein
MPIPSSQIKTVEIHVQGVAGAGGSDSRASDTVFFFNRQNTALALPTKTQLDTAFQAQCVVAMGALLNNRWLQSRNAVRWLDDAEDAFVFLSHAVVGAIAGDSMPTDESMFLYRKTGLRGRQFNSKSHLFPLSESDTTSGTDDLLNAACLARAATLNAAILAGFTDASGNVWQPVVFSKKGSIYKTNPTTIVTNLVTQCLVNKRIGSMIHRKVKSVY